jgi:phosphatidylserine/phosphatidylglycerophosphate/cardiolipin synthase-like enzyme
VRDQAKVAWPVGLAAAGAAWYASDSLRHRREKGEGYAMPDEKVDVGSHAFLRAAEALTAAPISWGDDVELLVNGDRIFPAYLETIAGAQRSLNLLTYAYWRGDIADEVARALCEKARSGVEVNVVLDAVGTAQMQPGLVRTIEEAGATIARFRPPKPYALKRLSNRNHRKILVADGSVGMIGGVGIAQEWTGDAQDPDHWRDTHLRVRGPVVRGLQGAFAESWLEATGRVPVGDAHLPDLERTADGGPMQLVRSCAGVGDTNVEALLGELRQPLLPAPRRSHPVRPVHRVRRAAHRELRGRPGGQRAHAPGAMGRPPATPPRAGARADAGAAGAVAMTVRSRHAVAWMRDRCRATMASCPRRSSSSAWTGTWPASTSTWRAQTSTWPGGTSTWRAATSTWPGGTSTWRAATS